MLLEAFHCKFPTHQHLTEARERIIYFETAPHNSIQDKKRGCVCGVGGLQEYLLTFYIPKRAICKCQALSFSFSQVFQLCSKEENCYKLAWALEYNLWWQHSEKAKYIMNLSKLSLIQLLGEWLGNSSFFGTYIDQILSFQINRYNYSSGICIF